MGRPPCCDKVGVKKGPWTPEEDIILVSYIQENGPSNWRAVPTNTGLLRCSKSCRLRWTNYLRPGIKRGNFTEQEEKIIIHLQELLGNRWAAIASYLPERTDNDIKNYWNTHLNKKLKKVRDEAGNPSNSNNKFAKGKWEKRLQTDIHMAKQALCDALSFDTTITAGNGNGNGNGSEYPTPILPKPEPQSSVVYASSTDNIARLLKNWKKNTPPQKMTTTTTSQAAAAVSADTTQSSASNASVFGGRSLSDGDVNNAAGLNSFPSFNSLKSDDGIASFGGGGVRFNLDYSPMPPLTYLEKWLMDDAVVAAAQGNEDFMDMSLGGTADLF